jgi:hypothetical protein
MPDKLIGSLIYGEHVAPKKRRPLKERLRVPIIIGTIVAVLGYLTYHFINYREEGQVRHFMEDLRTGQFDAAYAIWDTDGRYSMKDFLADWGKDGYYTQHLDAVRVIDSNTSGTVVIVYVDIPGFRAPLALLVDKQNLKLSFSPTNKYTK